MSAYPIGYLPWQARDLMRGPGVVAALVAGIFALLIWRLPSQYIGSGAAALFQGYLAQVGWPLVLVATGEIVRNDRVEGYHRFYFSRPVHPAAFYLVRFTLGFLLVLTAVLVAGAAVWLRTGELPLPLRTVGQLTLLYLLLGGTVFLLSTLFTGGPRDWLTALLVHVYQTTTHDLLARGFDLWPALRIAHWALPPMHLARLDAAPMAAGEMLHAGLYGAALLGISLAVLHFRPLGSGARD